MAKKPAAKPVVANKKSSPIPAPRQAAVAKSPVVASTTPIRNTPLPKVPAGKREITQDMIAKRAYEIYLSGSGGSESDNWHRAERELRGA